MISHKKSWSHQVLIEMLMQRLSAFVATTAFLQLAGCASGEAHLERAQSRERVLIPTPPPAHVPMLITRWDATALIPFFGAAKMSRDLAAGQQLAGLLAASGFNAGESFAGSLATALQATGTTVSRLPLPSRTHDEGLVWPSTKDLPPRAANECLFDVRVGYGFASAATGEDYVQLVYVNLQASDGLHHEMSWRESFGNEAHMKTDHIWPPTAAYPTWKNLAAIEANAGSVAITFDQMFAELAGKIVEHLQAEKRLVVC